MQETNQWATDCSLSLRDGPWQKKKKILSAPSVRRPTGKMPGMPDYQSSPGRNPSTPPKNFPGEVRGYQEPSGAGHTEQYKTRQESPPGPDRQDRTAHRNQKPSWAGLEAEASSGHDQESEALTGSLSDRLHIYDRGAGG